MAKDVLILAERAEDRLALVSSELCGVGRKLAGETGGALVAVLLGGAGTQELAKGLIALLVLVGALSRPWQGTTGAGIWGFRTAATLAVCAVTLTALGGLFFGTVHAQYPLGLLLLALSAGLLSTPRWFDIFALSAVALGLNALLVFGLVRWLGEGSWNNDWLGRLTLIGLFAAGLLAASVSGILRLSRRASTSGESA